MKSFQPPDEDELFSAPTRGWSFIYRVGVLALSAFSAFGWAVALYAGRTYVQQVAREEVNVALTQIAATINDHSAAVADYRAWKSQGPRFTSEAAANLRATAVAEANTYTTSQINRLDPKIEELNRNITELKVLLADVRARLR